jgi:hypothetical protein
MPKVTLVSPKHSSPTWRPWSHSMTRAECQDLFDAADARAERIRVSGRKC